MKQIKISLTNNAIKELIKVIDIAQNEGYGHSESTYTFRDILTKSIEVKNDKI